MPEFTIQQIEDYLNGSLPDSERTALEQEMSVNPDFQAAVAEHRLIFEGLKGMEMDLFRGKVGEWEVGNENENNLNEGDGKTGTGRSKWIIFGIVTALLVSFFLYQFFKPTTTAPEKITPELIQKLYVDNGRMEQTLTQPFQNLSSSDSLINQTLRLLKAKEYSKAINSIELISPTNKNFSRLKLLKGLCFLKQKDYPTALTQFQEVIDSNQQNFHLKEEAEWLEVVTMIISENYVADELRSKLIKIEGNTNHKYQEDASVLLKGL